MRQACTGLLQVIEQGMTSQRVQENSLLIWCEHSRALRRCAGLRTQHAHAQEEHTARNTQLSLDSFKDCLSSFIMLSINTDGMGEGGLEGPERYQRGETIGRGGRSCGHGCGRCWYHQGPNSVEFVACPVLLQQCSGT